MTAIGLIFIVAFAAGCTFAFAKHPIYGLLTYVGAFYIHPPSRWWGQGLLHDIRWSYIAAVVTLLAIVIRRPAAQERPFGQNGVIWGFALFVLWVLVQFAWALDTAEHQRLAEQYLKFLIVMFIIYRSLDSIAHLRLFMWSHVLGCFFFGWIAFTEYTDGRFEGFGGPGLSEANAAALTMVTGGFFAGSLFVAATWKERVLLVAVLPFIANGVVTTVSRSAFLAASAGTLLFNFLAPRRWKGRILGLTILGAVMFLALTNDKYWNRMDTVKHQGMEVDGVDMGGGRRAVMEAQLRMAEAYPLGCGHSCTEFLSPTYISREKLNVSSGTRASHNSFLSMLVDQGIVGAVAYLALLAWVARSILTLRAHCQQQPSQLASLLPGVACAIAANFVGDMMVPYVRYEVRFWFITILMVMLSMALSEKRKPAEQAQSIAPPTPQRLRNAAPALRPPTPR